MLKLEDVSIIEKIFKNLEIFETVNKDFSIDIKSIDLKKYFFFNNFPKKYEI